ncbi:ectopic P granules protein 5 homolog isoform X2 [Dysidea avara]|uniref:ectopic P granules protein 5 homolog isoform X2 n=1 Tax=Dysidea avara TaxID=196820 RepID=UPI00331E77D3
MTETKLELTTPTVTDDVDMKDEVLERTEKQVVVAKLEVSESVEVVTNPAMTELPGTIAYPRLDSLIAVGTTDVDDTVPYTEEELAALYPNPQLDANEQYIDQFIKDSQQDNHELYHLLIAYLRQRQSIVVLQCKVEDLNKSYERKKTELWKTESRTITTQVLLSHH